MSRGNTTVSLTLRLHDQASAGLRRMTQEQMAQARQVTDALRQQVAQARDVNAQRQLGIRTEQQIRAELAQVQRAYDHLRTSGRASANDIMRAQAALTEQTRRLNRELGLTEQTQTRLQRLQRAGAVGGAVVGGAMAAGMVLRGPLETARSYDEQLTYTALTATGGQGMTAAQRLAQRDVLNRQVMDAVRSGGGTRDDAVRALGTLIGSGEYDINSSDAALKAAQRTAFATGASSEDAATLTLRMKQFEMTDLQYGHDMAVRGGQVGSFEYRDLSKWLAQQLPAARSVGYSGNEGFAKIVTMNQLAMTTAGSRDEAGNNLVNLLNKLSSREFSDSIADAVQVQRGDPTRLKGKKKKVEVFNWSRYAEDQRSQGVMGVEAFMQLLDRQMAANADYQRYKKQAASEKTPEARRSALEAMSNIAAGSEIGKIIADRQALMAGLAIYFNRDKGAQIEGQVSNSRGTVAADSEAVMQTEWAKAKAKEQELLFANNAAYGQVSGTLNTLNGLLVDAARAYPTLTTAVYAGGVAVTAMSAAAGVASTALWALSRAAGGASLAQGVAGAGGRLKNAGMVATAAAAGYGAGTLLRDWYLTTDTGQTVDNAIGSGLAQLVALFSESAREAVETNRKLEQLNQTQRQALNKPVPGYQVDMNQVLGAVDQHMDTQAKRGPWVGGYR